MNEYFVYLLQCRDRSYYTGITNDLDRRLREHQEGIDPFSYTYSKRPVKLIHVETFKNINDAIACEKQIKNWSRKKKEALIQNNLDALPALAKKKWKK